MSESRPETWGFEDRIHEELQTMANVMCEDYCKYNDQWKKDQEEFDGDNPTYLNHCMKCPMCQFYT